MKKWIFLSLFLSQFAFAGVAHPTLTMLVSYDPSNTIGVKEKSVVAQRMQELQDFYQVVSYGNVNIQSQTVGPFVIPNPNQCDPHGDGSRVDAQTNTTGYLHKLYAYADPFSSKALNSTCKWVGLGSYGATVTQAWIAFHESGAGLYEHEYGHNLGFHHAASETSPDFNCTLGRTHSVNVTSGEIVFDEAAQKALGQCNEYGDPTDVVGRGGSINAPHRVQAGWLKASPVSESGVYTVGPLDSDLPKVLTFPKANTGDDYYLSSTRDGKTHIHRWKTGTLTQTVWLASLSEGQSFEDPANQVSIYVPAEGSVEIQFEDQAGCKRGKPSIGINPGYQYSAPGGKALIQVLITNHDSEKCKPTLFSLSSRVPSDVSYKYPIDQLTLKPGEKKWLDLNVQISEKSLPGQKDIWVYVKGAVKIHDNFSMGVIKVQ